MPGIARRAPIERSIGAIERRYAGGEAAPQAARDKALGRCREILAKFEIKA